MEDKYPIEKSGHGTNTFYVGCEELGRRQNYAVCQHVIRKVKEGSIEEHQFADCQRAIRGGRCESLQLMAEEQEAGHALYYRPRVIRTQPAQKPSNGIVHREVDTNSDSYKRGRYGQSAVTKPKQTYTAPPGGFQPRPQITEINAADIVNAAMEEDTQAAPEPEKPTAALPPRERGESPIAYRRRIKELMNNG